MIMIADGNVVVKVLMKICFTVFVEIMKASDLVAAQNINLFINNLEAKRLKQTSRVAAPFQFF